MEQLTAEEAAKQFFNKMEKEHPHVPVNGWESHYYLGLAFQAYADQEVAKAITKPITK